MSLIDTFTDQLNQLKQLILPKESEVKKICEKAKEIISKEPNLVHLNSPITVCGDIHGQFDDLLELFRVGGTPPEMNYLFLGDYVDRGFNSVETFLLFLLLKIKYEDRITLLRGNHESRQITQVYGFYEECTRKFGSINVWRYCTDVFDSLPLAAIIDNKIFCVHGGLSPSLENISDLNDINRFQEIPHEGVMSDILWSDPDPDVAGYGISVRGAGYLFGANTVDKFVHVNNIDLIARAHQLVQEGYKMMFNNKLVTVWSVPNYCYRCGNSASIMEVDEELNKNFPIFESAPTEARNQKQSIKEPPNYFL